MNFTVLTLFPEFIEQGLNTSILGRAIEKGLLTADVINIRNFSADKNGRVDDYTYGGGAGMLMQPQPVFDAYKEARSRILSKRFPEGNPAGDESATSGSHNNNKIRCIYVTPQGEPFTQKKALELSGEDDLIVLCGHYEGIDERVLEEVVTDRISIGDYVLTGGELPALVIIDAVARLVPGVLGNETSADIESFYGDLLEYPQYTRPEVWNGKRVPEEVLTGDPKKTNAWRLEKQIELTKKVRPDLFEKYLLRQSTLEKLLKDKRNNIQMIEALRRGTGDIICTDPLVIYLECDKLALVGLGDSISVGELLGIIPGSARSIVCSAGLAEVLCRDERIEKSCDVHNYVYTEKVHRRVVNKDIRRLGMEYAGYIGEKYALGGPEYGRERLGAGVVYGIFVEGEIAGFIGTHVEGSIGMLYVDEKYRHRGLAADLESFMFNRDLEAGRTPYGQIILGNEASTALQEKIGVYGGDKVLSWLNIKNA